MLREEGGKTETIKPVNVRIRKQITDKLSLRHEDLCSMYVWLFHNSLASKINEANISWIFFVTQEWLICLHQEYNACHFAWAHSQAEPLCWDCRLSLRSIKRVEICRACREQSSVHTNIYDILHCSLHYIKKGGAHRLPAASKELHVSIRDVAHRECLFQIQLLKNDAAVRIYFLWSDGCVPNGNEFSKNDAPWKWCSRTSDGRNKLRGLTQWGFPGVFINIYTRNFCLQKNTSFLNQHRHLARLTAPAQIFHQQALLTLSAFLTFTT